MKSKFTKDIKDTSQRQSSQSITPGSDDFWDDCIREPEEQQNWTARTNRKNINLSTNKVLNQKQQQSSKPITQGDFWDDCTRVSEEQQNLTERPNQKNTFLLTNKVLDQKQRKTTKKTNGKKKRIFVRLHEDAIQRKRKKQNAEKEKKLKEESELNKNKEKVSGEHINQKQIAELNERLTTKAIKCKENAIKTLTQRVEKKKKEKEYSEALTLQKTLESYKTYYSKHGKSADGTSKEKTTEITPYSRTLMLKRNGNYKTNIKHNEKDNNTANNPLTNHQIVIQPKRLFATTTINKVPEKNRQKNNDTYLEYREIMRNFMHNEKDNNTANNPLTNHQIVIQPKRLFATTTINKVPEKNRQKNNDTYLEYREIMRNFKRSNYNYEKDDSETMNLADESRPKQFRNRKACLENIIEESKEGSSSDSLNKIPLNKNLDEILVNKNLNEILRDPKLKNIKNKNNRSNVTKNYNLYNYEISGQQNFD